MNEQLTLYSAKVCPFAQRVEIALEEVNADYTRFEVNLQKKPEWFTPQVNPASKVPAVTFGGPRVPPDEPSPDSHKIAESLVLLEFVADLYPNSSLLPKDPVLRAKARFFTDAVSTKFLPTYIGVVARGEAFDGLFQTIEALQNLLPAEDKGRFAIGDELTIADISIIPFLARMDVALKNDYGAYAPGAGAKAYQILESNPKYARYRQYLADLKARDSFKATFDEQYIKDQYATRCSALRAQKQYAY